MAEDDSTGRPPAPLPSEPAAMHSSRKPRVARKLLGEAIGDEIRRLHKTHALLIAIQFAANHEAEFDVSDALAVIVALVHESIAGLDRTEAAS